MRMAIVARTLHGYWGGGGSMKVGLRANAPSPVAKYVGQVREFGRERLSDNFKLRQLTCKNIVDYLLTNSQQTSNLLLISSPTMFFNRSRFLILNAFIDQHPRHSP